MRESRYVSEVRRSALRTLFPYPGYPGAGPGETDRRPPGSGVAGLSVSSGQSARTPSYEAPEINPYSVEEVRRFLVAAQGRRNVPRWTLAAVIGLRQGEALGLQWGDFDADHATLAVRRQLRRVSWQHGCTDRTHCSKRGADCPMRHGGGLLTPHQSRARGVARSLFPHRLLPR